MVAGVVAASVGGTCAAVGGVVSQACAYCGEDGELDLTKVAEKLESLDESIEGGFDNLGVQIMIGTAQKLTQT